MTEGRELGHAELLALMPQREPFRFLDRISRLDDDGAVGHYRFRADEWFYRGHFPGNPVTPGVILLEAMAQLGIVALGLYLIGVDRGREAVERTFTAFVDAQVEFLIQVPPGEEVTIRADKIFFRRLKLRSKVELCLADGQVAASGVLSGVGVIR